MKRVPTTFNLFSWSCTIIFSASLLLLGSCQKSPGKQESADNLMGKNELLSIAQTAKNAYAQTNLVANRLPYDAVHIDPVLINGWGIAFSANGTPWVASQGGHVSTIYNSEGATVRPAVNIPSPGGPKGGNPTGVVFSSSTTDFLLPAPNGQPARFIFVGVDGVLSAWNGAAGSNAALIKNNVATSAYTGLAIANMNGSNYLYAANFRARKIEVFDKDFNTVPMSFTDPGIPAGYAPFNIERIDDSLYVVYAKVGPNGIDQPGSGNGYISIFTKDGVFGRRFTTRGQLNSPWGITRAPAGFFIANSSDIGVPPSGTGTILVGNFGNGRINAYDNDGKFIGQLSRGTSPVVIPGLWAITFPPVTATAIDPMRLYYAAGPNHETDGFFGYIKRKN